MEVLKRIAQLIRLPNLFTAASNIIAAHIVATHGAPQWPLLWGTLLASLCFYHGGMVLNDCIDITEDRKERPNRPLPSGLMPFWLAWGLGSGLMLTGLIICYQISELTFSIATALALAIAFYNFSDRRGYAGCVIMGLAGCSIGVWDCLWLASLLFFCPMQFWLAFTLLH